MSPDERVTGPDWDDGLIARRSAPSGPVPGERRGAAVDARTTAPEPRTAADEDHTGAPHGPHSREEDDDMVSGRTPTPTVPSGEGTGIGNQELRQRLGALRELIGLSCTRLDGGVLSEAGALLDDADARGRLPASCTTVALAGATGSGKSSLFNALAGVELSAAGACRPTTASPVACSWEARGRAREPAKLLDLLGVDPSARHRRSGQGLDGLVLIDLPDHDSTVPGHRDRVDRLLRHVDAVVWVVDPEKYADAVLHEHYLRPLAGHAEVTFVVLNQVDRLPGEAADLVLDDLRRLLDEDGMALGEHGEPGARVLATSALTGAGVTGLREELGAFVAQQCAPALRLGADLDGAVDRLRPVYAEPGPGARGRAPVGLTDTVREDFEDRLASAVGAEAAGRATERAWLRQAERACGTPFFRLVRRYDERRARKGKARAAGHVSSAAAQRPSGLRASSGPAVARPLVEQAVQTLSEESGAGLPEAWAATVSQAARNGVQGLCDALDALMRAPAGGADAAEEPRTGRRRPPVVPGAAGIRGVDGARMSRPLWWPAVAVLQSLLLVLQVLGAGWFAGAAAGMVPGASWMPLVVLAGASVAGPLLACGCRALARGPARSCGLEEERRLRGLASGCGRSWVLEPVAAELLRYREVREQYVIAAGGEHL